MYPVKDVNIQVVDQTTISAGAVKLMPQFLIDKNPNVDELVHMSSSEAHHLRDVFRIRLGDEVRLFDGVGTGFQAVVETLSRNEVVLRVSKKWKAIPPKVFVDCAVSLLPRDGMLQVIQRITEFGVRKLIPLETKRSIVKNKPNFDQWNKSALSACKQSERLSLPELCQPITLQPLLEMFQVYDLVVLAHPEGGWVRKYLESDAMRNVRSALMIIGPEGGFSESEISSMCTKGAQKVSFGSCIYRSEIAVAFLAAVLNYRFGGLDEDCI